MSVKSGQVGFGQVGGALHFGQTAAGASVRQHLRSGKPASASYANQGGLPITNSSRLMRTFRSSAEKLRFTESSNPV